MKNLIKTVIITLLSILILNGVTHDHEQIEIVTEQPIKSVVKLDTKQIVKTEIPSNKGKYTFKIGQSLDISIDKNLNEKYDVSTVIWAYIGKKRQDIVYSSYLYDIKPNIAEDTKIKEYNKAVKAVEKLQKINENKNIISH